MYYAILIEYTNTLKIYVFKMISLVDLITDFANIEIIIH